MVNFADNEARHLALLYRHMMKTMEKELAPLGLCAGRYSYLFGLYAKDGRRQQELADSIGIDKAAVARSVAWLEESGYVRRVKDSSDGRAFRVYLTEKGKKIRPQLETAALNCIATMTSALDEAESVELRRLLIKINSKHQLG